MFNCITGHTTEPKVKRIKLITERRIRDYSSDKFVEVTPGFRKIETVMSKGWEIVKEVDCCIACLQKISEVGLDTARAVKFDLSKIKIPNGEGRFVINRDEAQMRMSPFIN